MLNKPLLSVLTNEASHKTPIWLMRQAGRYLPEYRELRAKTKGFLDSVLTPEIAAEITLQPLKRFDLDAAIIFSDILVIPYALGINVEFHEGIGPVIDYDFNFQQPTKNLLKGERFYEIIEKIAKTVSLVREKLNCSEITTIGFAGAPWTVACYMLEKHRSKSGEFENTRKIAYQHTQAFEELINFITDATIEFLLAQIAAGAEVIKIFDSHAGLLGEREFATFVIKPLVKIIQKVKKVYPQIPIIGFPRRSGQLYERFIEQTKVDCVAIDHTIPLKYIKENLQTKCVVQGNLDNILLTLDLEHAQRAISDSVEELLVNLNKNSPTSFIFNLGHGCLPSTKVENIEVLIKKVRNFQF